MLDKYGKIMDSTVVDKIMVDSVVYFLIEGETPLTMAKSAGLAVTEFAAEFQRLKPDAVIVIADRFESLAIAMAASYMNIPVAHLCGGDRVIGNVDDQVRHAVTKLSHLHLVTNRESFERILRLGEQPFRIFEVGNPGLDRLLEVPVIDAAELSICLGFTIVEGEPLVILIQHVISTEIDQAYEQMKISLDAVSELGIKTILSYPNSDAGGQQMIRAIHEYDSLPFLFVAKNIPRLEFVNLIRRASCLLGNSSAGILEAPLLKLPAINVGNRQRARLHAENVQFIPHDKAQIIAAIRRAIYDKSYRNSVATCSNPYGDGKSSARVADILAEISIDDTLLIKDITY